MNVVVMKDGHYLCIMTLVSRYSLGTVTYKYRCQLVKYGIFLQLQGVIYTDFVQVMKKFLTKRGV